MNDSQNLSTIKKYDDFTRIVTADRYNKKCCATKMILLKNVVGQKFRGLKML